MTKAGCSIQSSAIYKIEKSGRRITVDELVALANVWDLSVEQLLEPVEMILHKDITEAEEAESKAWEAYYHAVFDLVEKRHERAALYRRALSGGDETLGDALEAFWRERELAIEAQIRNRKPLGPGGLAAALRAHEREEVALTPQQRAERQHVQDVEDAMGPLDDAIRSYAEQLLEHGTIDEVPTGG